jgi:putative Ca2+/H+ antiporter (TMEM165/GDT1 family)
MEWLAAGAAALVLIVPVELPDKTFVATLVLSTRYRPLPVWVGATAAFGIQCLVAAAAGGAIALLPTLPVRIVAAALFLVGGVLLLRGARRADEQEVEQERTYEEKVAGREAPSFVRASGTTFLVLFAAEWGDLSQLLTAGLVASGRPAVPVFVGSWLGLTLVAGLGVLLGRVIVRRIRLSYVRYVGAGVCLLLGAVILFTLVTGGT